MAKVNRPKPSPANRPTPSPQPLSPRPGQQATIRTAPTPGAKLKMPASDSMFSQGYKELIFGRQNYFWGLIGVGLIALGLILMMGGGMPNPDMWDDNIIYSFRIVTLAPFLIVAGLVVEIYAIFVKKDAPIS